MQSDLLTRFAEPLGLAPAEARPILSRLVASIHRTIDEQGGVFVPGLGTFRRDGTSLSFDVAPDLAEAVNQRYAGLTSLTPQSTDTAEAPLPALELDAPLRLNLPAEPPLRDLGDGASATTAPAEDVRLPDEADPDLTESAPPPPSEPFTLSLDSAPDDLTPVDDPKALFDEVWSAPDDLPPPEPLEGLPALDAPLSLPDFGAAFEDDALALPAPDESELEGLFEEEPRADIQDVEFRDVSPPSLDDDADDTVSFDTAFDATGSGDFIESSADLGFEDDAGDDSLETPPPTLDDEPAGDTYADAEDRADEYEDTTPTIGTPVPASLLGSLSFLDDAPFYDTAHDDAAHDPTASDALADSLKLDNEFTTEEASSLDEATPLDASLYGAPTFDDADTLATEDPSASSDEADSDEATFHDFAGPFEETSASDDLPTVALSGGDIGDTEGAEPTSPEATDFDALMKATSSMPDAPDDAAPAETTPPEVDSLRPAASEFFGFSDVSADDGEFDSAFAPAFDDAALDDADLLAPVDLETPSDEVPASSFAPVPDAPSDEVLSDSDAVSDNADAFSAEVKDPFAEESSDEESAAPLAEAVDTLGMPAYDAPSSSASTPESTGSPTHDLADEVVPGFDTASTESLDTSASETLSDHTASDHDAAEPPAASEDWTDDESDLVSDAQSDSALLLTDEDKSDADLDAVPLYQDEVFAEDEASVAENLFVEEDLAAEDASPMTDGFGWSSDVDAVEGDAAIVDGAVVVDDTDAAADADMDQADDEPPSVAKSDWSDLLDSAAPIGAAGAALYATSDLSDEDPPPTSEEEAPMVPDDATEPLDALYDDVTYDDVTEEDVVEMESDEDYDMEPDAEIEAERVATPADEPAEVITPEVFSPDDPDGPLGAPWSSEAVSPPDANTGPLVFPNGIPPADPVTMPLTADLFEDDPAPAVAATTTAGPVPEEEPSRWPWLLLFLLLLLLPIGAYVLWQRLPKPVDTPVEISETPPADVAPTDGTASQPPPPASSDADLDDDADAPPDPFSSDTPEALLAEDDPVETPSTEEPVAAAGLYGGDGLDLAQGGYTWVVTNPDGGRTPEQQVAQYRAQGFRSGIVRGSLDSGVVERVCLGQFATLQSAREARGQLPSGIPASSWVLRLTSPTVIR